MIPNEGGYGMNRARIYILAAVTVIWASVLSPTRATAAHRGSDATNLHDIHHALVQGGTTALGEGQASQVMSQLLADIPGKQVVILAITYPPGHSGAVHRHNAHAFAYVLEGSVVMGLNDGTPVTLTPGQTFYEGPNDIHTISRNASKTKPAKFLVFLIKDKNAPITVPAK
jgi:quercetin dioxygenase-like cupin family protein